MTYEELLQRMLETAAANNTNVDTREGSVVWLGQAPAAVELRNMYAELDQLLDETFADTASREMLIKRARERGLSPRAATKMVGKGEFTPASLTLSMGARFSLNNLNYSVVKKLEDGTYELECETPGEVGSEAVGTLIPIEYIAGLETAKLTEILIPGEDDEETEAFRARYFNSLDAQAFGGNVADYLEKVNPIDGVGGAKVYCAWNGGIRPASFVPPSDFSAWLAGLGAETPVQVKTWLHNVSTAAQEGLLTVGGTVRIVIIDSTYCAPSVSLVEKVQNQIDPPENHAEGLGLAPIGHFVTVRGVGTSAIDMTFHITYKTGWTWPDVKPYAEIAVDDYFKELARGWDKTPEGLVVRISQLEMRLLNCSGVLDVGETTINGADANLTLDADCIPVRGTMDG